MSRHGESNGKTAFLVQRQNAFFLFVEGKELVETPPEERSQLPLHDRKDGIDSVSRSRHFRMGNGQVQPAVARIVDGNGLDEFLREVGPEDGRILVRVPRKIRSETIERRPRRFDSSRRQSLFSGDPPLSLFREDGFGNDHFVTAHDFRIGFTRANEPTAHGEIDDATAAGADAESGVLRTAQDLSGPENGGMPILADRSVLQQNGPQADIFAPFRAIENLQQAIVNEKRLSAIRACQRLGRRRFQKGDRNSLEGPVPNAEFTPRTPTRIKSIGRAHQFVARHPIRPGNGADFVQALSENETTRHQRMPPIRVENEMPFHRRLSGNASADQRGGLRLAALRLQRGPLCRFPTGRQAESPARLRPRAASGRIRGIPPRHERARR